jgi:hypothetical protein
VDSIVTAARGIGILWLGAGLLVTFLLARRLGANEWSAAGATLLLASTPVVIEASATITTDAPELLVGGVLTLLAIAVVEKRVSPWWLVPAGAVATAFKTTSLTVIGMVGLFLLIHALRSRRETERSAATDLAPGPAPAPAEAGRVRGSFAPLVLLLVAGAVPLLAWTAFSKATSFSSVDDILVGRMFKVDSIGWNQLAESFRYLFTPVNDSYMPPFMRTDSVELAAVVLNVLLIVGTAGLAWFGHRDELPSSLATSVFASMVLGGPALAVMLFFTEHVSYGIPGRYGLSLLPAATACVAVTASQRRLGGPVLVLLGIGGMVAYLASCA